MKKSKVSKNIRNGFKIVPPPKKGGQQLDFRAFLTDVSKWFAWDIVNGDPKDGTNPVIPKEATIMNASPGNIDFQMPTGKEGFVEWFISTTTKKGSARGQFMKATVRMKRPWKANGRVKSASSVMDASLFPLDAQYVAYEMLDLVDKIGR